MRKRKSQRPQPVPKPKFSLEQEEPQVPTFTEIGGSPVPGLTLRHVLRGHTDIISRIAWSPDGRYLASPSVDKTIRIWDVARGKSIAVLKGDTDEVHCIAWSPDGTKIVSGSGQIVSGSGQQDMAQTGSVRIWEIKTKQNTVILDDHENQVWCVAWSPNGKKILLGSGGTGSV